MDDGQSLRELGQLEAGCLELLRVDARWKIIVLDAGGQNLELVSDEVLNIRWVDVVVTCVLVSVLLIVLSVLTIIIVTCGRRMMLMLRRVVLRLGDVCLASVAKALPRMPRISIALMRLA